MLFRSVLGTLKNVWKTIKQQITIESSPESSWKITFNYHNITGANRDFTMKTINADNIQDTITQMDNLIMNGTLFGNKEQYTDMLERLSNQYSDGTAGGEIEYPELLMLKNIFISRSSNETNANKSRGGGFFGYHINGNMFTKCEIDDLGQKRKDGKKYVYDEEVEDEVIEIFERCQIFESLVISNEKGTKLRDEFRDNCFIHSLKNLDEPLPKKMIKEIQHMIYKRVLRTNDIKLVAEHLF